jgi:hypothetical protein
LVIAIAGVAAYKVLSSPATEFSFKHNVVETTGPWRLHLFTDDTTAAGCTVTLTDLDHDSTRTVPTSPVYGKSLWQMSMGKFRLKASSNGCHINAEKGAGDAIFPQTVIRGDSEAFNPTGSFTVEVAEGDFNTGDTCVMTVNDAETGTIIDRVSVTRQDRIQEMENGDRSSLYLSAVPCAVTIDDP